MASWLGARFCREDDVFLKMDIEGAEFEVLEHLLKRGAAQLVDTVSIEWHTQKRGAGGRGGTGAANLRARQKRISAALEQLGVRVIVWGDARLLGAPVKA